MATYGCDYSYSRPDIAAMARDGVRFACRYLRDGGKALSPSEAARLTAAGIAIVANDETTGSMYLGGFDGGRRDARAALAAAVACGMPANGRPIYFTPLDHDPAGLDDAGWSTLRSYARGVVDVLGVARVGWYGGTRLLRDLAARDLGRWWWQARGWRDGVDTEAEATAAGWHLRQYQNGVARWGGEVDYDQALRADFGQWGAGQGDLGGSDLTMADAQTIMDAIDQLRSDLTVFGTTGLENTVESYAARIRNIEAKLGVAASTEASILATVKTVIDIVKAGDSDLSAAISDLRSALLGAIIAQPGMSEERAQQIVDGVIAGIQAEGVQVDPAPLLQALREHPLVPSA